MKKKLGITQEEFNLLLSWLDQNQDRAVEKYELIQLKLIKFFSYQCGPDAEELAVETIERVTRKVRKIAKTYFGKPDSCFYGFAKKVLKEHLKRPKPRPLPPTESSEHKERLHKCLNECLEKLTASDRNLIMQYYEEERKAKINLRKQLAEQYGLTLYTLRVRTHRIRLELKRCIEKCLEEIEKDDV